MAEKEPGERAKLGEELTEQIRAWIRARQAKLGISLYALADLSGISYTVLNKFLNRRRDSIDLIAFIKLRTNLQMDLNDIVDMHPKLRERGGSHTEPPLPPSASDAGQGRKRGSGGR